jgi:hypothetical protein
MISDNDGLYFGVAVHPKRTWLVNVDPDDEEILNIYRIRPDITDDEYLMFDRLHSCKSYLDVTIRIYRNDFTKLTVTTVKYFSWEPQVFLIRLPRNHSITNCQCSCRLLHKKQK